MQLIEAMRLDSLPCIAVIGSGGKTTTIFRLARELIAPSSMIRNYKSVIVTATTHMSVDEINLSDVNFIVEQPKDLQPLYNNIPEGVILITGKFSNADRTKGLEENTINRLYEISQEGHIPLIIEADGSRRRPLKAPSVNEPVVPAWVDTVVVVAGISALGKPLTGQFIHRTDLFSKITGLPLGGLITPEVLLKILTHRRGSLRNIPNKAHRILILNQADTLLLQQEANKLAPQLLDTYNSVIVASLKPTSYHNDNKRSIHSDNGRNAIIAAHEYVAGIVLAAGESRRLKQPKQLLIWRNKPLIRHITQTAIASRLKPVVVVTGAYDTQVRNAIQDLPISIVYNAKWNSGQSSSITSGLNVLPDEIGAVVFLLADQPMVSQQLINSLIAMHAKTFSSITAPLVQEQRANPVLFDRRTFQHLLSLTGDTGGRELFSQFDKTWLPWEDEGILFDVDKPGDLKRLRELEYPL